MSLSSDKAPVRALSPEGWSQLLTPAPLFPYSSSLNNGKTVQRLPKIGESLFEAVFPSFFGKRLKIFMVSLLLRCLSDAALSEIV